MKSKIILGNNLKVTPWLANASVDLVYIDPPFNTGKTQTRGKISYPDTFDDFEAFIKPRMVEARRMLKSTGSMFFHIDARESHYCKVWLDKIFGRENFRNQIVWAYDYGGRSKKIWSRKHDVILWYTASKHYTFNFNDMERIPYMAPGLVGKEKASRGKTPTDVWWHTIVATNGKEKTGYPTQKPLGVLRRIINVHTNPGDLVVDFFAGSGTTGDAAGEAGRTFVMVDSNPTAYEIMRVRLEKYNPEAFIAKEEE